MTLPYLCCPVKVYLVNVNGMDVSAKTNGSTTFIRGPEVLSITLVMDELTDALIAFVAAI